MLDLQWDFQFASVRRWLRRSSMPPRESDIETAVAGGLLDVVEAHLDFAENQQRQAMHHGLQAGSRLSSKPVENWGSDGADLGGSPRESLDISDVDNWP